MGNSLRVVLDNYIGSAPIPCHLQLGESSSIDLSRSLGEKNDGGGVVEERLTVSYTVDTEKCFVELRRYDVDEHGNAKSVCFLVLDHVHRYVRGYIMEITETNHIHITRSSYIDDTESTKRNRSFDAWGGVMDTSVHLYGNGSRWGLVVIVESNTKGMVEETKVVTVAHYLVKGGGTSFNRSAPTDIGLSVVAKFGVSNGNFHITVEGPEQHPVSALLYMFGEVNRTGIWKPTMCPHCDQKRRGKVFWQSDSEDSDSVPIPLPRATARNGRGVSNGGRFQGNGNGNIYENNVIVYRKRW